MTVPAAHRIRRALLVVFAAGATLGAHAIGSAGIHLTGRTVMMIAALAALVCLAPVNGAVFAPRGPLVGTAVLLAAQLVSHTVLSIAPSAVGMDTTHATHSSWTAIAVGVHIVLAVQLGILLTFADRLLATLVRVIHAARVLVARLSPRRSGTVPRVTVHVMPRAASSVACQPRRGRGPPVGAFRAHAVSTESGRQVVCAAPR